MTGGDQYGIVGVGGFSDPGKGALGQLVDGVEMHDRYTQNEVYLEGYGRWHG